jgi:hypothetical protein
MLERASQRLEGSHDGFAGRSQSAHESARRLGTSAK